MLGLNQNAGICESCGEVIVSTEARKQNTAATLTVSGRLQALLAQHATVEFQPNDGINDCPTAAMLSEVEAREEHTSKPMRNTSRKPTLTRRGTEAKIEFTTTCRPASCREGGVDGCQCALGGCAVGAADW